MRPRPVTQTSEKSLAEAMAARGRLVSLSHIANWRKSGLLPPLAVHGLGPGKGRMHCWHDTDIVDRAELVFDALKKHGRAESALVTLFLAGFAVPLAPLRRAFGARARNGKPQVLNRQQQMWLERAATRLGYDGALCPVLMAAAAGLDAAALTMEATDDEMRQAQQYLVAGLNFLAGVNGAERDTLAESLAHRLFLFILAQLRAGQEAALEKTLARMENMDRPPRPVHALRISA